MSAAAPHPGRILALVGAAGAGKDTLSHLLAERSPFRKFANVTTRPMRPTES